MAKVATIILATVFILSGVALLFESFGIAKGVHNIWPIFSFIIGLGFLLLNKKQRKRDIVLTIIGWFMMLSSLLFVYLNLTSWTQVAFLWPVFITFAGISFLAVHRNNKSKKFLYMGIGGILLSLIFIFIFGVSASLWPVSLIVAGIFLYIISIKEKI